MGSNEVPPGTPDFGTVSGTKLHLEPARNSGNCNLSNLSSLVPPMKVTVIVTKFLFMSNFPIPAPKTWDVSGGAGNPGT